jgi:cyclohexyl-isocyanide hydratase
MIQLSIEYAPAPPFDAGRPDTAPPEIVAAVKKRFAAFTEARRKAVEEIAERM